MLSRLNTRSRPSRPSRTGARRTSSGGGSGGGPITLIADQYGAAGDTGESGDWGLLRNGTWEYIAFGSCNGGGAAAFDFKLDGVNQTKQAYHTWASNYANYRVGVAANEGVFDADAVLKAAGNCNQLYNTVFRVNAGYEIKQVKSFGPDFGPAAAEPITLTFDAPCAAGNLVIFQIVESGTFTRPANVVNLIDRDQGGGGWPGYIDIVEALEVEQTAFTWTKTNSCWLTVSGVEVGPV